MSDDARTVPPVWGWRASGAVNRSRGVGRSADGDSGFSELLGILFGESPPLCPADPNFSENRPVEGRVDGFFLVGDPKHPTGWIILEVQTSIDPQKRKTLPLYLELAGARFGTRGDVILLTADEDVARYYDAHAFTWTGAFGTSPKPGEHPDGWNLAVA